MKASDVIAVMEKHFPLSLQEKWDKCGLQIGDVNQDVHKIMIALNADNDVLNEAINQHCDMLITHHPFLLDKINNIDKDHFMGQFIFNAIKNNVVVYSSHTALDKAKMNDWLIEELGVHDVCAGEATGISRIATLNTPMSQEEFINHVKKVYHLEHLKYAGRAENVSKVALCGGSAADFLEEFYGVADAYITGDTKYRNAKNAHDHGILLIDINHHAESIMVIKLKELLEKEVNVEIVEGHFADYYHYI